MTPDRGKEPLPFSTSFMFPEQPSTYQQWKTALQLVKTLYLRGQYKECAARCSQLTSDPRPTPTPLHAMYLHFYCALSNEAKARLAHPLSTSKLHVLEQAKAFYEAAALSLLMVERVYDMDQAHDDSSWSVNASSISNESEVLDYYQSSPGASSPSNDPSSPSSVESENIPQDIVSMKPAPLRIRKSSLPTFEPTVDNPDNQLFFRAFSRTPSTPPSTQLPSTPPQSRPLSIAFTPPSSVWLCNRARERYSIHLISFTEMLSNHISTVDILIRTTREAQAMRYFAKRLASYGEDEAAKEADLQARRVKLKAAGWRRERFRPEKYQDLCERALEEL